MLNSYFVARAVLAFIAFTAIPTAASAQSPCGAADSTVIKHVEPYFTDTPVYHKYQQRLGYTPIAATDLRAVVTGSAACAAIVTAVRTRIKGSPELRTIDRDGWKYTVIRLGPYLTMHYSVTMPPNTWGHGVLYIYRESGGTLSLVGSIMI